jgi:hypothetical protein
MISGFTKLGLGSYTGMKTTMPIINDTTFWASWQYGENLK